MTTRRRRAAVSAAITLAIGLAIRANAAEIRACSQPAAPESLETLRPTLQIVADDYEKLAAKYTTEAERYRTWASAEEMFGSTAYGKRYAVKYFEDHATELDGAAAESRRLAEKYRHLADSAATRPDGC